MTKQILYGEPIARVCANEFGGFLHARFGLNDLALRLTGRPLQHKFLLRARQTQCAEGSKP